MKENRENAKYFLKKLCMEGAVLHIQEIFPQVHWRVQSSAKFTRGENENQPIRGFDEEPDEANRQENRETYRSVLSLSNFYGWV